MKERREKDETSSLKSEQDYETVAIKRGLALHALRTSKHKGVVKMLRDQFIMKEDKYSNDLNEAYELLNHFVSADNIPETKKGGG